MQKFIWLLQLFFAPNAAKKSITNQAILDENKPKGEERWEHVRNREGNRIDQLRAAIGHSLLYTICIILIGVILVVLLDNYVSIDAITVRTIRVTSIILIAWAVIFRLGYVNDSWSKNTIPEQMQTFVFKFFYFIGVLGITISMYLN